MKDYILIRRARDPIVSDLTSGHSSLLRRKPLTRRGLRHRRGRLNILSLMRQVFA